MVLHTIIMVDMPINAGIEVQGRRYQDMLEQVHHPRGGQTDRQYPLTAMGTYLKAAPADTRTVQ
jgi:hypothetical protein